MPTERRFVFDTHVIVSALLLQRSVVRQAFDKAIEQGKLLVSHVDTSPLSGLLVGRRWLAAACPRLLRSAMVLMAELGVHSALVLCLPTTGARGKRSRA